MFLALRGQRLVFATGDASAWRSVRETLRGVGPMMLGLGVIQINIVVDGLIASWPSMFGPTILGVDYPLASGALTALTNASRLYEFPLGVFGISIATAIFPVLARVQWIADQTPARLPEPQATRRTPGSDARISPAGPEAGSVFAAWILRVWPLRCV